MIPFEGSVRKFGKMSHLSATKSLDHKTSIFDDAMENPHCSEITIIPDVAWSRKKATKMEMVGLGWIYGLESGCNDCWDFCICPALHLCTGWPNKSLAPSSTFFSLSSAKVSTRATLNVEKYYWQGRCELLVTNSGPCPCRMCTAPSIDRSRGSHKHANLLGGKSSFQASAWLLGDASEIHSKSTGPQRSMLNATQNDFGALINLATVWVHWMPLQ